MKLGYERRSRQVNQESLPVTAAGKRTVSVLGGSVMPLTYAGGCWGRGRARNRTF